eukprot:164844_1
MATAETIRSDIVVDGCDADINEKLQESLYVCSNESFIYSTIGDEKGNPIDGVHILYFIVSGEIGCVCKEVGCDVMEIGCKGIKLRRDVMVKGCNGVETGCVNIETGCVD